MKEGEERKQTKGKNRVECYPAPGGKNFLHGDLPQNGFGELNCLRAWGRRIDFGALRRAVS